MHYPTQLRGSAFFSLELLLTASANAERAAAFFLRAISAFVGSSIMTQFRYQKTFREPLKRMLQLPAAHRIQLEAFRHESSRSLKFALL